MHERLTKPIAEKPVSREYPYWMTRPCPRLLKMKTGELSQQAGEARWQEDQKLYEFCRRKHAAFVREVLKRDVEMGGTPLPKAVVKK